MHRSLSLTENTMLKKRVRLKFKYGFNTISKIWMSVWVSRVKYLLVTQFGKSHALIYISEVTRITNLMKIAENCKLQTSM